MREKKKKSAQPSRLDLSQGTRLPASSPSHADMIPFRILSICAGKRIRNTIKQS